MTEAGAKQAAAPDLLIPENIAGALAYVTFVPAVVFLVMEPYRRTSFVRFHSMQCLLVSAAGMALWIALAFFGMLPLVGLLVIPLAMLLSVGSLVLWVVLVVKALSGEPFQLPYLGPLAERQSRTF